MYVLFCLFTDRDTEVVIQRERKTTYRYRLWGKTQVTWFSFAIGKRHIITRWGWFTGM